MGSFFFCSHTNRNANAPYAPATRTAVTKPKRSENPNRGQSKSTALLQVGTQRSVKQQPRRKRGQLLKNS